MLNVFKLNFDSKSISGNDTAKGIISAYYPVMEYINNSATDNVIGYKYATIFPDNNFERVYVRIDIDKPLLTANQISEANNMVHVCFKNLRGKIYKRSDNGELALSVKADGFEVV